MPRHASGGNLNIRMNSAMRLKKEAINRIKKNKIDQKNQELKQEMMRSIS